MIRRVLFVLIAAGPVFAQQHADSLNRARLADKTPAPLRLEHADELENQRVDNRDILRAIGHVEFSQDTLRAWCDESAFFRDAQIAVMIGRVKLYDLHRTIFCDKARYYAKQKKAVCEGNVLFIDSSLSLVADSLVYYQDLERMYAQGNVVAYDSVESVALYGREVFYDIRREYVLSKGHPHVIQFDSTHFKGENAARKSRGWATFPVADSTGRFRRHDADDQVSMTALTMESHLDSNQVVGNDSVVFTREKLTATAGHAVFDTDDERLTLRDFPRARYDVSEATGDTMVAQFLKREIASLSVRGHAEGYSVADSVQDKKHRLSARTIVMDIREKELHLMKADGNALSVYYLENDEGKNEMSGPTIVMFFNDGKLKRFRVEGGAEGTYYPESFQPEERP